MFTNEKQYDIHNIFYYNILTFIIVLIFCFYHIIPSSSLSVPLSNTYHVYYSIVLIINYVIYIILYFFYFYVYVVL